MKFERLTDVVLTQRRQSSMLELVDNDPATEIQTKINNNWVHDANDSPRPPGRSPFPPLTLTKRRKGHSP